MSGETGTNTLISGPSRLTNQNLTGLSVGEVRERFADTLNIPEGATVSVNSIPVSDDQVLVNGEEIIFSKPLGVKG